MKCFSCNRELSFPEAVLKQLSVCPFCEAPFNYEKIEEKIKIQPQTITEMLVSMIEEFGFEIFDEKNSQKLLEQIASWPAKFREGGDIIRLLCIKNIPHILYTKRNDPHDERQKAMFDCAEILNNTFLAANQMVDLIQSAFNVVVREKAVSQISTTNFYSDPRDGNVYKIAYIGDQVWFAENFRYDCEGSFAEDYAYLDKYGRLYDWESAKKNAPPGWRLPFSEDFKKLRSFAKQNCPSFSWDAFSNAMDYFEKTGVWQKYKSYLRECYFRKSCQNTVMTSYFLHDEEIKKHMNYREYDTITSLCRTLFDRPFACLYDKDDWNGTDAFGFCAKPAGYIKQSSKLAVQGLGQKTSFWTTTESNEKIASSWCLTGDAFNEINYTKTHLLSVRYILDT